MRIRSRHTIEPTCRWCGMSLSRTHRRGVERVWGFFTRRGLYTCEWCHRRQWHRNSRSFNLPAGLQRLGVDVRLRTFVACLATCERLFERVVIRVRNATTTLLGFMASAVHASRALLRPGVRFSLAQWPQGAYPIVLLCGLVFLCGLAIGVVMTVGRMAPDERATAPPVPSPVRPAARLEPPVPASSAVSIPVNARVAPVPTNGVDPTRRDDGVNARTATAVIASAGVRPRRTPQAAPARKAEDERPVAGGFRGSVAVGSRPEGAEVFVNGQRVGRTPLVLTDLPVGSRAIRLTMDGHQPWSRAIQVVANQRASVTATLQRAD